MEQKVAVITGGNSGIGHALAQALIAVNYRVIVTSRTGTAALANAQVVQLDLGNHQSIEAAGRQIIALGLQIDLLINNAGVAPDIGFALPTYETFKDTIAINLTGTVAFAELLLPLLAHDAQIVNISSAMGLLQEAAANAPAYRIAKAGLNMYTKILAKRYAYTNVRAFGIHPGWVSTKLGGPDAPLTAAESAKQIFQTIKNKPLSGQFINIQSDAQFAL